MARLKSLFLLPAFLIASILIAGCSVKDRDRLDLDGLRSQPASGFPYHPLIYHMDLSILAYQLYARTLVWPFDPYYEELSDRGKSRQKLMAKVHAWSVLMGTEQADKGVKLGGYRGPGALGGFPSNRAHDPIIYDYGLLSPWGSAITHNSDQWIEYITPREITAKIKDVYVCYRSTGMAAEKVAVDIVASRDENADDESGDILLAFEGETGSKGEAGRPGSQSLMGFVLLRRTDPENGYDIHIAFRGSRSGSASRALRQALSDREAKGNPDWITDLGNNFLPPSGGGGHVTTIGSVHRGFATSIRSIFPNLFACLEKSAKLMASQPPRRIFVTGHSLGGGLAQHLTSAVLSGNSYGPNGAGPTMPLALSGWPWKQVKLITFSAPRAGDKIWAKSLTEQGLQSDFFSSELSPVDRNAIAVDDPAILERLSDAGRPVAYRVLIPNDPITTEKFVGGKHVGKTVYVDKQKRLAPLDIAAHEPKNVRIGMIRVLDSPLIPPIAWHYRTNAELGVAESASSASGMERYRVLKSAIGTYYHGTNQRFDQYAFERNYRLIETIRIGDAADR